MNTKKVLSLCLASSLLAGCGTTVKTVQLQGAELDLVEHRTILSTVVVPILRDKAGNVALGTTAAGTSIGSILVDAVSLGVAGGAALVIGRSLRKVGSSTTVTLPEGTP